MAIPVYIKKAGPMNLGMDGVQMTTDLLADTGTGTLLQSNASVTLLRAGAAVTDYSWRVNDVMHVVSDGQYQIADYTVRSVEPPRGLLPTWRIVVIGAVR